VSKTRLLIVEDEPNIVESLRFILEQAGFAVVTVGDGSKAIDTVRATDFAAVILDVMLPGTNGMDILKIIRGDTNLKTLPVIVLTAKGQARDRQTAEELGATAFITKPFSNAEVVARVRELTAG
jgi:DNA-binding response OmpR family regulator